MKIFSYVAIAAISAAMAISQAGEPAVDARQAEQGKPSLYTSESRNITAVVEAVDHETRLITLRSPEGDSLMFTASKEAHNLDQVEVGDLVNTEYVYHLSIEVYDNRGQIPGDQELLAVKRAGKGEVPELIMSRTHEVTATVQAINIEANTARLKWPDGSVEEFTAPVPEDLKKVTVGDIVVITQTSSVAISVEELETE